jgi:heme exporter protein A
VFPAQPLAGRNLACVRGGRLVFRGLDCDLGPGEALVVTGANGSGKSTLLRLLAGLIPPFAGSLTWAGRPVAEEPDRLRRAVAYAGHQDAVKRPLTVAENLAGWARLEAPAGAGARVDEALSVFGLDGLAGLPARYLSAGQKRRLGLARLLAAPRPVWLLDEPTVALDRASVEALLAAVSAHRAAGGSVAIASHAEIGLAGLRFLDMTGFAENSSEVWAF